MSCNINEYLDELNIRTNEVKSINQEIINKRNEYIRSISILEEKLRMKNTEVQYLRDMVVSVRLGDLIDELSWLSGIDASNIEVIIKFNMIFSSMDDFLKFTNDNEKFDKKNQRMRIRLCSRNLEEYINFDYFMFLIKEVNVELIKNCSVSLEPYSYNDEILAIFSIEKNAYDLSFDFNLGELERRDNTSWYPSDLFLQAVYNCVQRDYNRKTDKIREKVRK